MYYLQNLLFDNSASAEDWYGKVLQQFGTFQYLTNDLLLNLPSVVVPIIFNNSLKFTPMFFIVNLIFKDVLIIILHLHCHIE